MYIYLIPTPRPIFENLLISSFDILNNIRFLVLPYNTGNHFLSNAIATAIHFHNTESTKMFYVNMAHGLTQSR